MDLTRKLAWVAAIGLSGSLTVATSAALTRTADGPDPRTVQFQRGAGWNAGPVPVTIECGGVTWRIHGPGLVQDIAAEHCQPGENYTWSVTR